METIYWNYHQRKLGLANKFSGVNSYAYNMFCIDDDGEYYINIFDLIWEEFLTNRMNVDYKFDLPEYVDFLKEYILNGIAKNKGSEQILSKYRWMLNKYNGMIKYFKSQEFLLYIDAIDDQQTSECINIDFVEIAYPTNS